jgi:outer membrane protein OmpA-like peptidoglycan-associated protein
MRSRLVVTALMLLLLPLSALAASDPRDDRKCKDHPLLSRVPGHWIHHCEDTEFDRRNIPVGQGRTTPVEGRVWHIVYNLNNNTPKVSEIQTLRNYQNAIKSLGGAEVYSDKGRTTFRVKSGERDHWVELWTSFAGGYQLFITQSGDMAQDVTANAAALANDIRATGHAAVYGILFDTGKADIKPESAQAIGEIAKLLKNDSALELYVVGHTDNIGSVESNLKLSDQRAQAVLKALVVEHGIAAARLRAFGCAQFAPVDANDSEEGRAKNRRVDLVKQ